MAFRINWPILWSSDADVEDGVDVHASEPDENIATTAMRRIALRKCLEFVNSNGFQLESLQRFKDMSVEYDATA